LSAVSCISFFISSARSPFSCTELPRSKRIESSRLSVRRASVEQRSFMSVSAWSASASDAVRSA
jgi:hypothetical protein